jgi:hypothetical protein
MQNDTVSNRPLLCPSAQTNWADSVMFGIVGGTVEEPRLIHLTETQPVTDELLALSQPANPTEVFRFAAPCAGNGCQHFDGSNCRLATKIVHMLPTVVEQLPPCHLRPTCRWWQQEGKAACLRCPQIVTETYHPSEHLRQAADPAI